MGIQHSDAERLFAATGIDLEQVQVIGVEGDPDVEALARARIEAVKQQANGWLDSRAWQTIPNVSRTVLPVPILIACDFCGDPHHLFKLRWKWVGVRCFRALEVRAVIPLGGLACRACYPLSRKELVEVARRRDATTTGSTGSRRAGRRG